MAKRKPGSACPKCDHFACICEIETLHRIDCPFRRAATCPIGIECEHGRDCCPVCDSCTCDAVDWGEGVRP